MSWYTDATKHTEVMQIDHDAQKLMRLGSEEKDFVTYANTDRNDPLEWRYKGEDRLRKLKSLKREWDPRGVFTHEFL